MLLASFTGAQSTGKSTLLDMCMDTLLVKSEDWLFIPEVTRLIKRQYGVDINEQGIDDTQLLILNQHLINTVQYNRGEHHYMMDRCIMDGYVYSKYLHTHGRITDDTMCIAECMYRRLLPSLDIIFYTHPVDVPIHDDGERSINPQFRDEIIQIYNDLIFDNQKWVKIANLVVLKGTPSERMNVVTSTLKKLGVKL